jgi:hypothetical protein
LKSVARTSVTLASRAPLAEIRSGCDGYGCIAAGRGRLRFAMIEIEGVALRK